MGNSLSETARARRRRWSAVVLAVLACFVISGCAQRDRSADEQTRPGGGFYGGVSGGMTR
jgi:hypothetical protein